MTPHRHLYFDYRQAESSKPKGIPNDAALTLADVYMYEPIPAGLSAEQARLARHQGSTLAPATSAAGKVFFKAVVVSEVIKSLSPATFSQAQSPVYSDRVVAVALPLWCDKR